MLRLEEPALEGAVRVGRLLDGDPDLGLLGAVLLVVAAARPAASV